MAHPDPFCAQLLESSAQGLAALAVERLFERHPDLPARYQPHPAIKWRESLTTRIGQLAAAVAVGCPPLFVHQAEWDKLAHHARGGERMWRDLEAALTALRDTVDAELPAPAAKAAVSCLEAALTRLATAALEGPRFVDPATPTGRIAAEYLLAILEGDRRKAADVVLRHVRMGDNGQGDGRLSVTEVYEKVLAPAQQELGRLWHLNESTVAEEHFATATTHMVVSMLYPHLPRRAPNGRTALCASVQGNAHDIGVRMIADHLEMDGFKAVYLGANVPIPDLVLGIGDFGVNVLALSAGLGTHLPALKDTIEAVRASHPGVKIMVGGGAFAAAGGPRIALDMGADAHADSFADAVATARRLTGLS